MAEVIGELRPDATIGEQEVLERLRELPNDYIVWPELIVSDTHPDFVVLVPQYGIAILEVKDWVNVIEANPHTFIVRNRQEQERRENNPIKALREKAFKISNKLESEPGLLHSHGPYLGKLRLGYAYAVIFPRLPSLFIYQLGAIFDPPELVINQDQIQTLGAVELMNKLNWRFRADLTSHDIDLVRRTIFPELKIEQQNQVLGVMDLQQEQIAKEGLTDRVKKLDKDMTEHGRSLSANMVIRLVRGVVGSGKTLVLTRRAYYLAQTYPDWKILVLTYNKALAHDLQTRLDGIGGRVQATHFHQMAMGLLREIGVNGNALVSDRSDYLRGIQLPEGLPSRLTFKFLSEEIGWIKDMNLSSLEAYLAEPRIGRGRPLAANDRRLVYEIFQRYEDNLDFRNQYDWDDVPRKLIKAIEAGALPGGSYDAILVDEAQDFAPTWFRVLQLLLKPGGAMFLAADGVQRIYRKYSWKSLGLNVVGRSRTLQKSYRNTYEITHAAKELLRQNSSLVEALKAEGEELPQSVLDKQSMRRGPWPTINQFFDKAREAKWLKNRIADLLAEGYQLEEIALFHRKVKGVDEYAELLQQTGYAVRQLEPNEPIAGSGITVGTMHATKGLEFKIVFIPQLQLLFERLRSAASPEDKRKITAEEIRVLYVAMTRARDKVLMTYQGQLPSQLKPLDNYLRQKNQSVR